MATNTPPERPFDEAGVAGFRQTNGFINEEFLPQLHGQRGRQVYRQMRDNDATIASVLFMVEMLIRSVEWRVEVPEDDDLAAEGRDMDPEEAQALLESILFDDMETTWDDFISEVLSFLVFGWSYFEVTYKRRIGPFETDPSRFSNFTDGLIGIRKIALRPQETLWRWDIDENGNVMGMEQQPPNGGNIVNIPIDKALLFRAAPNKSSPEGRSILRGAYRSWYHKQNIENIEAIAIERELAGLPIAYIPASVINKAAGGDSASKAVLDSYEALVKNIKNNEQGGAVLPSDTWTDSDGRPSGSNKYRLELLTSGGQRAINTNEIIRRYANDIARTVLAQFVQLGNEGRGSFALSKDQSAMFLQALEGWLEMISTVLNRCLIPRVWRMNNLSPNSMPFIAPGPVAPENLEELGTFLERMSRAGAPLFPDDDLEADLRDKAGLPQRNPDDIAEDAALLGDDDANQPTRTTRTDRETTVDPRVEDS